MIAAAASLPRWRELVAGLGSLSMSFAGGRPGGPRLAALERGEGEGAKEPPPGRGTLANAADRAVVCDVLSRRPGAVAAAWRHFLPFVQRTVARLAARDGDREDLVQEVFERFFRRVDGLRNPDAVRPFLYGIALRVVKKDHRYRWLRRNLSSGVDACSVPAAASDPELRAAARRLVEHLAALGREQRSLIVARYVEGMDLKAVAEAHGLSFNTMRRRLERAWRLLERRLDGDEVLAAYRRGGRS
jgi:RNA polymerase sigma-70 factor (ECF subfamily)